MAIAQKCIFRPCNTVNGGGAEAGEVWWCGNMMAQPADRLLRHDAHTPAQVREGDRPDVGALERDDARVQLAEPRHRPDATALARTSRNPLAGVQHHLDGC